MEMWSAYCPDLLEELLVVTPIKAIEHAVSQNGYDSSELHRLDALATARSFITNNRVYFFSDSPTARPQTYGGSEFDSLNILGCLPLTCIHE